MQNFISILAFGHIPKFRGGRQQSGLANAMWSLATHMADPNRGIVVKFCATDVYVDQTEIDGIEVIGWTWLAILKSILHRPLRFLQLQTRLTIACLKYGEPVIRTSLKGHLLRSAFDRTRPDFVHLHTCQSVVFLEAGITEVEQTVVTIHGDFGATGPARYARMESALTRMPLRVLSFVTSDIKKSWYAKFGRPLAPVAVVLNAYDSQSFFRCDLPHRLKGGEKKVYHLVSIGNVSKNKGQSRVVEAIVRFSKLGAPYKIRYTMVGQSMPVDFAKSILKTASDTGVSVEHHHYLPPNEIRTLLWAADYMILASENEGFGLVFLESIACGTPVVLSKTLPICREEGIISSHNSVLLESHTVEAILEFLKELPQKIFTDFEVSDNCSNFTWKNAGRQYRNILTGRAEYE